MDYDDCLVELGEFGPWQMTITLLLWIPPLVDGIMTLTSSYTALAPSAYRCNIPGCDEKENFTFYDFTPKQLFPSLANLNGSDPPDHPNYCDYFKPASAANGSCLQTMTSEVESCGPESTYAYAQFKMGSTLITEFDMVCDKSREIWVPMTGSCFMLGLALGSLVFGILSDKIGRRHTLLMAILTASIPSVVASQMPDYVSYALLRVLIGAGSEGCFIVAFAMAMEIVGSKEEVPFLYWVSFLTLQGNLMNIPFAIGEVLTSFAAMAFPNWRDLELAVGLVCMVTSLVWFFIPESPRWLIAQGRLSEAKKVLKGAARRNGVRLSEHLLNTDSEREGMNAANEKFSILDCFHPSVLPVTLALFVIWPVITLVYYGLTFSADKIHLTENTYVSFIAITLIELPSAVVLILLMDIWGRKPLMVAALVLPGASCIAAGVLEKGAVFTLCVLFGKFCAAGAFTILHIATAELYPTAIRNSMLGVCSTIARVGGISAPWIAVYLPDQGSLSAAVPLYIFGACSAVAGLLAALCLTESLGSPLPSTFKDVERMKANAKPAWKCVWPSREEEEEEE